VETKADSKDFFVTSKNGSKTFFFCYQNKIIFV